jgi:predicted ester cyclase
MTTTTSSTLQQRNKDVVLSAIDLLFTRGEPDAAGALLAPDFVDHDPTMGQAGTREGFQEVSRTIRRSFPDWHSVPYLMIAEDDLVVEVFTASGSFTGEPAFGHEPTGAYVELKGINVFRLRDGRIVERWGRIDDLGFQAQLAAG